eukprot:g14606.t1
MMKTKRLWLVNVLAYVVNAIFVGSSSFGWLGSTNGEVSDNNRTFVTPATWAFSIWGFIFLFELLFVVWGALEANRDSRIVQEGVGWWFAIACVVQAVWSVLFAQELLVVSAILLCVIAFSLFMGVISLSEIHREGSITPCTLPFWGVYLPIGVHGGWTLAAALININLALELTDVGAELSALILSVVAASVFASFGSLIFYSHPYLVAIAWAIAGIADEKDYRRERLGGDIADGVDSALEILRIALLVVGFAGIFYRIRKARTGSASGIAENPHPNRTTHWSDGHGGQTQTSVIISA